MQLLDGAPVYSATDLVGFLACGHRFELERAAMAGLVRKPVRSDPTIELVQERGYEHERRYLEDLRAAGRSIVEIAADGSRAGTRDGLREAAALTLAAMQARADVVYQATFFDERWRGHADFLLRVDHAPGEPRSALGDWHYEVADTKLARHVKAGAVLQVCSYVEQLERVQGRRPEHLHVALGGSARETVTLRVDDYMAYFRRVKADFLVAAGAGSPAYPPAATYPEPVEHCEVCRWWADCSDRRRADDDLSLVAGISARQRRALKELPADEPPGPIATRRGLARLELPLGRPFAGGGAAALARVREQARIQVAGDEQGEMLWELLEPEWAPDPATGEKRLVADRGFLVLPEPSPNDLFLDLEGDPFAFDDGIDYLFGILDPAHEEVDPRWAAAPGAGRVPAFRAFWSRGADGLVTPAAEKAAFERTVDFLVARLDADPTLHVYHYAAYEKTALARLAQRHATREDEVDRLLRGRVLVDLYRVVRQGIRASVESYSIKRLEPLYGFERDVALRDAGSSIVAFEVWLGRGATAEGLVGDEILRGIEGYNRDDVVSTRLLRDWLEARRRDLEHRLGTPVPRPRLEETAVEPPEPTERQAAAAAVVEALLARIPSVAPADLRGEDHATWLLAQLLGWHRRENKAFWWRYYDLCGLTDAELAAEREPIGMVSLVEDLGPAGRGGRRERYTFPPQDHGAKVGRRVDDPRAQAAVGTIEDLDELAGTVVLYRTATQLALGTPASLIPFDFVPTRVIEDSLLRFGRRVAVDGLAGRSGVDRAGRELLCRRPPRIPGVATGTPLRREGETALDAARRLVLDLDGTTLPIQGPPGTGKTWTGARMILALVAAGRRVGVTGSSHKVIGNVLDAVRAAALEARATVRLGQKPGQGEPPTCRHAEDLAAWSTERIAGALAGGALDVVGGTAWLWSAEAMEDSVDILLVDEAGQFSLANTIAISPACRSLVLLGDPRQLDQPLKGSHPPGAERSALGHLLAGAPDDPDGGEHATMPPELGLFLDRTWRLHPAICDYTSEVFYASQLEPVAGLERQAIAIGRRAATSAPAAARAAAGAASGTTAGASPAVEGSGVRWLPVTHGGNATDAPEEAAAIVGLVRGLLDAGARWTNATGEEADLRLEDIVVVAPYNAHVDLIAAELARAGFAGARVGTVDKFQGQEAPLSIYAMGSSSPEDAPRGMEFLYSLNRLNVATSRARCGAVVVASPALVRVACRTPRQMQLANALCRLVEVARG